MGRRQALRLGQEGAATGALDAALDRARAELQAGKFFEAHETLEAAWMTADGDLKTALQGLIQICAGRHKLAGDRQEGARYLLSRGLRKLHKHSSALPPGAAEPFVEAGLLGMAQLSEGA